MTATTTYLAITDPSTKSWHIGTPERAEKAVCGSVMITPSDTRPWALRVPAEKRNYTTDADLAKVTCKACKKNRQYVADTTTAEAATAAAAHEQTHPRATRSRRAAAQNATVTPAEAAAITDAAIDRDNHASEAAIEAALTAGETARARRGRPAATGDPRADRAANDEAAADADAAAATPRPRKSRAARAAAKTDADRARREALAADADATVAAIEAAVATVGAE